MTIVVLTSILSSCDFGFKLPEAGSIPDLTPPTADFAAAQNTENFLQYDFANLSNSATIYEWDFGDGNSSTDLDPSNIYPDEGTYTVTLTVSDNNGVSDTFTSTVEVVEPEAPAAIIPVILEASFEDNSLPDGSGDGRDSWRNDFGGVIQITSSPVQDGSQASKFPSDGSRAAYQEMEVSPNTDYVLTYYYTLKTGDPGSVTVTVLGGGISDISEVPDKTLAAFEGTDQASSGTYVKVDIPFNTGANNTMAILITNKDVEARVDALSIALQD